MNERLTDS